MTNRLKVLNPEDLDPRQREIHDDIVASRGSVGGLFWAWLRNPEMAERAQKLGAYCRYETSLSPMLSELAILVVARHWRAQVEWVIHAPIAEKAGLPAQAIAVILSGGDPDLADPESQLVYQYVNELLARARVGDLLHARAVEMLGENGVVDLVGLVGYYGLVALTLNAFEVPVPVGKAQPFAE